MTTLRTLAADVTLLRKERNHLRDLATRRHIERRRLAVNRLIDRALLDALALIHLHIGGGAVGRMYSPLPARRWAYAAALLRMARLTTNGRDLRLRLPDDPHLAIAQLEEAAAAARIMPPRYARHVPAFQRPALLQSMHQTLPDSRTAQPDRTRPERAGD